MPVTDPCNPHRSAVALVEHQAGTVLRFVMRRRRQQTIRVPRASPPNLMTSALFGASDRIAPANDAAGESLARMPTRSGRSSTSRAPGRTFLEAKLQRTHLLHSLPGRATWASGSSIRSTNAGALRPAMTNLRPIANT
jgi:hypothetical protein